jgi:putative endonuclease
MIGAARPPIPSRSPHFVYIVRCADGSLYTGYARDPLARVALHNAGKGARYTRGRRPVRLVHTETYETIGDALSREHAIKQLTRPQKQKVIQHARATQRRRTR